MAGDATAIDWLQPFLVPVNHTLNRLLRLDPASRERLRQLAGRRLAVVIEDSPIRLAATFDSEGLALAAWPEGEAADAVVRGSAVSLLALVRDPHDGGDRVSFNGDLGFVRDVRRLLASLDIEWEEQLAGIVGTKTARRLGATGRRFRTWADESRQSMESGMAEYLTEESRLLPTRAEAGIFLSAVDRLREDADRLAARLQRLEARLRSPRNDA